MLEMRPIINELCDLIRGVLHENTVAFRENSPSRVALSWNK